MATTQELADALTDALWAEVNLWRSGVRGRELADASAATDAASVACTEDLDAWVRQHNAEHAQSTQH